MNFIKAEDFLKQPKEIQDVFIKWWKPSEGDLVNIVVYIHNIKSNKVDCIDYEWWKSIEESDIDINNSEEIKQFIFDYIGDFPLLSEGQLRNFINEHFDKSSSKVELEWCNEGYKINIVSKINDEKVFREFQTNQTEPIKAYWKVAIEIAKESVRNGKSK